MCRRLAFVLALAACHHDAPRPKAPESSALTTAADELGFLPGDADIVGGIDFAALRRGAMWKLIEPTIAAGVDAKYDTFKAQCGFDPLKDLDRAAFGATLDASGTAQIVIVARGVRGERVLDCIGKEAAGYDVSNQGGVLSMVDRAEHNTFKATVVGGNTLVAVAQSPAGTLTLEGVLESGAKLRSAAPFMAMFDRREPNAAAWGIVTNAQILAAAAQIGAQPRSLDATLVMTDNLDVTLRAAFATPADATTVQQTVEPQMTTVKALVGAAELRVLDAVLSAHVVMSNAQLETLIGLMAASD